VVGCLTKHFVLGFGKLVEEDLDEVTFEMVRVLLLCYRVINQMAFRSPKSFLIAASPHNQLQTFFSQSALGEVHKFGHLYRRIYRNSLGDLDNI